MTMAGFTEFDIFRSHQIREGKLTREQAYEIDERRKQTPFQINRMVWTSNRFRHE